MKHPEPLKYGRYYHVYNRGIDGTDIFRDPSNYLNFFRIYEEYIIPVADTYAWVLMKNHFHFLIRIKHRDEIGFQNLKPIQSADHTALKKYNPTQQFSNLFNAYTKGYNKKYSRTGGLLERPFKRICIGHEDYFRHLVYYSHNNPVHHGFCENMSDYPWSSYLSIISFKPTKLHRQSVIGWFNSKSNFVMFHKTQQNVDIIKELTIE
jgi:REP element-mobilizing transposase RayT